LASTAKRFLQGDDIKLRRGTTYIDLDHYPRNDIYNPKMRVIQIPGLTRISVPFAILIENGVIKA
jgi:hypothetical protein